MDCDFQPANRREIGAGNEIRTRDPNLGKVVLYQLSYSRLVNEGVFYGFDRFRQPLFSTFCFIGYFGHFLSDWANPCSLAKRR